MSYFNGKRIDDFAEAKKASSSPAIELRSLIKAGRNFLLSLEDAGLTAGEDSQQEHKDVKDFRAALDRAAKAVRP